MADQTVGNQTTGDENSGGFEGYVVASKFTTPGAAGGGTCTFYVYCDGSATDIPRLACGVWADSAGAPGSLVATGPTLTPGTALGWVSGTFTWTGIAASTDYWLGYVVENTAGSVALYDTATVGGGRAKADTGYPTLQDPFPASPTTVNRLFCVYVVYPESAGSTARIGTYYARMRN